MAGSGDRTQERRGSRQILAIDRRRNRRARRLRLAGAPGVVRVEHVDDDAATERMSTWMRGETNGGTV